MFNIFKHCQLTVTPRLPIPSNEFIHHLSDHQFWLNTVFILVNEKRSNNHSTKSKHVSVLVGVHLFILFLVSLKPLRIPYFSKAVIEYAEQVG